MVTSLEAMDTGCRMGDSEWMCFVLFCFLWGLHADIKTFTTQLDMSLSSSLTGPPLSKGQTEGLQWCFPDNKVLLHVSTACCDEVLSCF